MTIAYFRRRYGSSGFLLSMLLSLTVYSYFAVFIGEWQANSNADNILKGSHGHVAYCRIKDYVSFPENVRKSFRQNTQEGRMRKIFETEHMIYLFPVFHTQQSNSQQKEKFDGESFGIKKNDLYFCRITGVRT